MSLLSTHFPWGWRKQTIDEVPALCQAFNEWPLAHSPNSFAKAGPAFSVSFQEQNLRPRDVSNVSKVTGWEIGKLSVGIVSVPDPGFPLTSQGRQTKDTPFLPGSTQWTPTFLPLWVAWCSLLQPLWPERWSSPLSSVSHAVVKLMLKPKAPGARSPASWGWPDTFLKLSDPTAWLLLPHRLRPLWRSLRPEAVGTGVLSLYSVRAMTSASCRQAGGAFSGGRALSCGRGMEAVSLSPCSTGPCSAEAPGGPSGRPSDLPGPGPCLTLE